MKAHFMKRNDYCFCMQHKFIKLIKTIICFQIWNGVGIDNAMKLACFHNNVKTYLTVVFLLFNENVFKSLMYNVKECQASKVVFSRSTVKKWIYYRK